MCAIAGMIGLPWDEAVIKNMLHTMKHRGPDGQGTAICDHAALLHTRLAIIDPEGGKQPMELNWAGERYILTYNGELYNTESVRKKLLTLGHIFSGHSDTEVVLHAYAQWGRECLQYFNGIYAFAVWEAKRKRAFLARDRMGVKPLFYKLHESGLLFSSELKTILAYPSVRPQLDRDGIYQLVMLGPGRIPGSGVFHGIAELKGGCCAYYENGKFQQQPYWSLQDREHRETFDQTAEHVRSLVLDAIHRQTVSDVPIGTFLSGGLDSSLISAVCCEAMQDRGEPLSTFSVDYENNDQYFVPGKFQPNSDNAYIRLMEQTLNTEHFWTVLTPQQLLQSLEASTQARDLPGMADVDFSLHAFCGHIRKQVKVALSGECADEIFGGYPWYRDPEVRALEGFPWAQNTAYRASFLLEEHLQGSNPRDFVMDLYSDTIRSSDILPDTGPEDRRIKEMVNLNQTWFMQTLLDRKDRMSMHHGLEVRVPFCDHTIAEYLYGVPWHMKDHGGMEKGLLRTAMEGILPKEVLWRKKSPYPKTHDPRYLELVSARLRDLLEDPGAPIFTIIKRSAMESLLQAEYTWPWYGQLMKLPQTIAYMLQIDYWLRHYHVELL